MARLFVVVAVRVCIVPVFATLEGAEFMVGSQEVAVKKRSLKNC